MDDTLPEAKKLLDQLYKKFSGEEKILMASEMFNTARNIIISSFPNNFSKKEKLKALILRLYKDDFSGDQINDIFKRIDEKVV